MAAVVALQKINERLKQDRKVVFVHGVFDLFHIGHAALFEGSARLGWKLIVGVDSDEFAEKVKRRPIYSQRHRMELISKLPYVDYIIPLKIQEEEDEERFYWKMYSYLKPNYVTCGENCAFYEAIDRKCKAMGIETMRIRHPYKYLNTSYYLNSIMKRYQSKPIEPSGNIL